MGVEKVFSPQTPVHVMALENAFFYHDDISQMELQNGVSPQKHGPSLESANVFSYDETAP